MEESASLNAINHIPESLKPFFWDIDVESLSLRDFSHFIILGHRLSADLDFFVPKDFEYPILLQEMREVGMRLEFSEILVESLERVPP